MEPMGPWFMRGLFVGVRLRLQVRHPGPSSDSLHPDFWRASSRAGPLGEFPTFEAAAQGCEDEARRLIEPMFERDDINRDLILVVDHWKMYVALPHRLRSRRTSSRRR